MVLTGTGELTSEKFPTKILESISENIIVTDAEYNIVWLNPYATELLKKIIPLFDIESLDDLIGMNMGRFHVNPAYQEKIMESLTTTYRSRINIKDTYIADIIINPINDKEEIIGYVVMLADVTTKVQEENRKEKIIQELSGPTLHIWDNTLALPLIGTVDNNRFSIILNKLLKTCEKMETEYVLIDMSGLNDWDKELPVQIEKLITNLELLGAQCIIVGVKPKLAQCIAGRIIYRVRKFNSSKEAIKYIISQST
ncbi:STAS domain-containing protein [Virgibacillus kekensis]|uniref:STAS domain-containing protein n=1 Tax=Virgibacillus kekensis TaxID=202261 RepID=A0ABV9DHF9_9BACI